MTQSATGSNVVSSQLRRLVAIQQRDITQDAVGGQATTWKLLKNVYADIQPMNAQQILAAQMLGTKITHSIGVRYDAIFADPVVTKTYRVLYGARIFQIEGQINEGERDRTIMLHAVEGLTQG